jgi:mono/diheme cytochrome c family protein
MKKTFYVVIGAVTLFGLIQLVPFGHGHTNPPVTSEPDWSSPQARALVKEHCFQCHSNETEWTWYSNIAPASWLISMDVSEAREHFNFSDWKTSDEDLDELKEAIEKGEMPPIQYWIFHPKSKMNAEQKKELIQALETSIR